MDAADLIFWFCVSANVTLAGALAVYLRRRAISGRIARKDAKRLYALLCFPIALFSGVALFLGMVDLFHVFLGHGEVLIAAPLFNLLLAPVLVVAGRLAIGRDG